MSTKNQIHVRQCRESDGQVVASLIRQCWPKDNRNQKYWSAIFSNTYSKSSGFILEKVSDCGVCVLGIVIYRFKKPNNNLMGWCIEDFNCQKYEWDHGFADTNDTKQTEIYHKYNNNTHLQHHWEKLSSYIVHVKAFAIDPLYRSKGYGTYLMKTVIKSFPNKTRFGLEVNCANMSAIALYKKCGFVIKRSVEHYYEYLQSCYKMVLIMDDNTFNDIQIKKDDIKQNSNMKYCQMEQPIIKTKIETEQYIIKSMQHSVSSMQIGFNWSHNYNLHTFQTDMYNDNKLKLQPSIFLTDDLFKNT